MRPATAEIDAILDRMRTRGGRATATRRAIIGVLLREGHGHLSAEDVVKLVRVSHPDIAESTVYRTLLALEDLGVVEHVHLGHGPSTYHVSPDTHQHLSCLGCGAVIEVPDEVLTDLADRLQAGYGFRLRPHHFALVGECTDCQHNPTS
ncbi:MAG: Fur family transcriptional regulator [Acidimicrobiales bacterium]